jgi:thymidylate synthase (FAD)
MGSDLSVVDAARVSFDKESDWEQVHVDYPDGAHGREWQLSAADTKLINYLAKHKHWSPFAHTAIKFRVTAPIFVARQLVKHQIGLTWNEVSRRYVDSEPNFFMPDVWRSRPDGSIKQGSGTEEITHLVCPDDYDYQHSWIFIDTSCAPKDGIPVTKAVIDLVDHALEVYNLMLVNNITPEQARMVLPQNMMTSWIWTGSLYAFNRICTERLNPHAQQETREVAEHFNRICAEYFPVSWKALEDNR